MTKLIFISFLILSFQSFLFAQRDLETITSPEELKQYIYQVAPKEDAFVALQRLAKPFIEKKDWNGAVKIFKEFQQWFLDDFTRIQKIIDLLEAPAQNLEIINIETINTKKSEYFPVLTIDGLTMYFTFADGKYGGEDIYYSKKIADTWIKPQALGPPFCSKENDAINSISADGNIIVLFGSYKGHLGGGDNYYAEKTQTGWSNIKPFPKPINSAYWDCDGFLTADGKAFLFTSDRPGNIGEFNRSGSFFHGEYDGNTDIYVSVKTSDGWANPINLGNLINTPYTERSPFLHPDGKTLYFSSDGHCGLGSLDVFKSVRLYDTSWTQWSEPVNLGKEINTAGYDVAYKITTDGKYAFFASDRPGGKGAYDIYRLSLPKEAMPEKNVLTVFGKVIDENNNPLDAEILWYNLSSGVNVGKLTSDPITGEYIITLPNGYLYSYFAERSGYYSVSNTIDLIQKNEFDQLYVDIILKSIIYITQEPIVLNNIYFDTDKYELKPESFVELDRVIKFLNDNPGIKIEISAHTDSRGSDEYNLTLSQKRAESVVNYIILNGIDQNRLTAAGYGEKFPVADNSTAEGMAKNRRVEMKILN
jgi:outer membrane protein OmpA-like peptidoglycan-associated protein